MTLALPDISTEFPVFPLISPNLSRFPPTSPRVTPRSSPCFAQNRSPQGARITDGHNLGCELWVDLTAVYADVGGVKHTIPADGCVVLHADPRLLLVRVTAARLKCTIAVAHAPHHGRPLHERKAWWKDFTDRLSSQPDVTVAADANARLGSVLSDAVGPGGFSQEEDANGELFHRALQELSLVLPATFEDLDRASYTWTSKADGLHRIDYVAVPCAWRDSAASTTCALVCDADTFEQEPDHRPVAVRLAALQGEQPGLCRWRPAGVDRRLLDDPRCVEAFRSELRNIELAPWRRSVDAHEKELTCKVHDAAMSAFGRRRGAAVKSYISDDTMGIVALRRKVRAWMRQLKERAAGLPSPAVSADAVRIWAGGLADHQPEVGRALGTLRDGAARAHDGPAATTPARLAKALGTFIRDTACRLRARLRADSAAFLDKTAENISLRAPEAGARLAWRNLRVLMAFGGGARWRKGRQMPHRARPDGSMAVDRGEIAGVVLDYFAKVEAAKVVPWDALADAHSRAAPAAGCHVERRIDNVCSLGGLKLSFAHARPGKAGGPDGILDDYMRAAPDEMARAFHPLMVKMALRCEEPLLYKGGVAVDLYKGSGPSSSMARYRSILLNSAVCKHHHRFMRGRLLFFLQASFLRSQCGGLPGRGADAAAHVVRAFLCEMKAEGATAAVTFIDLWSGFYTVVRQLVMRVETAEEDLTDIIGSLGVPRCFEDALRSLIAEPTITERLGLDPHLAAMLTEAHSCTWFCVEGRELVAQSRRGSRPGCALADLVFNLAFTPALREVGDGLRAAGFLWDPPAVDAVFRDPGGQQCDLSDTTFADDVAFCTALRDNRRAAPALAQVFGIISSPLMKRGMALNLV